MLYRGSVNIICDGPNNCRSANFYCPEAGICNIECSATDSCYNVNYYIPNEEYEGFELDCNSSINDACEVSDIRCTDSGLSTTLSYGSSQGYWICAAFNCCPWREGNITCQQNTDCLVFSLSLLSLLFHYLIAALCAHKKLSYNNIFQNSWIVIMDNIAEIV